MKFAHLTISKRNAHSTILSPVSGIEIDPTGLLRARTWLAYLYMEKRLLPKRFPAPATEWTEYSSSEDASPLVIDTINESVVAIIPYIPYYDYTKQPGRALVRNDVNTQLLFTDVWLRSSISYLQREPIVLQQIRDKEASAT